MLKIVNQLAIMYKIDPNEIITLNSRISKIVEARRIYIYYLYSEQNIKHTKMREYVKGIDHYF